MPRSVTLKSLHFAYKIYSFILQYSEIRPQYFPRALLNERRCGLFFVDLKMSSSLDSLQHDFRVLCSSFFFIIFRSSKSSEETYTDLYSAFGKSLCS